MVITILLEEMNYFSNVQADDMFLLCPSVQANLCLDAGEKEAAWHSALQRAEAAVTSEQ